MGVPRVAAGFGLAVVVGVLGGCTGTPSVDDSTLTSTSASAPPPPAGSVAPTSSGSGSGSNAPSTPVPTTTGPSISGTPSVSSGNAGAYTTVGTDGSGATIQVATLRCGQDGSVVAAQIQLSPGGRSVTIVGYGGGDDLTVPGSADLDASGGTFRGTNGAVTVEFTWVC